MPAHTLKLFWALNRRAIILHSAICATMITIVCAAVLRFYGVDPMLTFLCRLAMAYGAGFISCEIVHFWVLLTRTARLLPCAALMAKLRGLAQEPADPDQSRLQAEGGAR